MIGIKILRENPQLVKENLARKKRDNTHIVDEAIKVDEEYRQMLHEEQQLRALRNKASEEINQLKKEGKDIKDKIAQIKEIPEQIKQLAEKTTELEKKRNALLSQLPNIMHEEVPEGNSDEDNVELERFGEIPTFDFKPKPHQQIAEDLGMADFESAATTSGAGFYYLQGDLALLNQALLRFATDYMVKQGFTYVETPLMLRNDIINRVTDLNDQDQMIYRIGNEDLSLIGTSEHSLIGRYVDQTIDEKQLPITHTSYSMCFRKEKGSHGLDERGLFRTHQFNKIEMIVICKPEESEQWYKKMQEFTVDIFKQLELPIRVLQICTGDLGDLKHTQVDIEAWSPRRDTFIEVGSCSNLTDAQSQLLNIRANGKERYYPHTLNNTAIATSRALVALLENNQTKEGTVRIPKVLQPYMYGKTELRKE